MNDATKVTTNLLARCPCCVPEQLGPEWHATYGYVRARIAAVSGVATRAEPFCPDHRAQIEVFLVAYANLNGQQGPVE